MIHKEYIRHANGECGVLFIHGFLGSPAHFEKFIKITPDGCGIHNILLYGHGGDVKDFSRASMEKWISQTENAFIQMKERYERIIIIAHSMGTLFAYRLAKKYPDIICGMILLGTPLKISVKPTAFINSMKSLFGFISEKDAVGKAYSKAHSVKLNLKLWEYIGWIPRYIELFSEAKAGIKNIQDVCVRCFIFQSAHDELVSRKSERYIPKKENIKLKTLENSAHFIYDSEDEKLFLDLFTKLLSSN